MTPSIPIQNLYYLLIYSWNRLAESEVVNISGIDSTRQVDLFASVLAQGVRHLIRRGLEQGYQNYQETIPGIRGRIDMATTARRALAAQGLAHCEFDELTTNTANNQIIRSTLYHLAKVSDLDGQLRKQLVGLYRELDGIDCPPLKKSLFRRVQHHGNARFYRFLLNVCELVAAGLLVDQEEGGYRFRDFLRDEKLMARVYEEFLFNFYRTERPDLSITKERISWTVEPGSSSDMAYLPGMETDISVRSKTKTLVIDAKYYVRTLTSYYDTERIHSSNLYQLFAYLKNMEARGGPDAHSEGMLLYPTIEQELRLNYRIQGHNVRICTVNLAENWKDIKEELHDIVGCMTL
ncbi:5-methylcytosine-specific restriction endonuclease system specificity protein McrC [Marinimicrobium alkaliphilum]|uniref:5-methylcytosine-specific restriction endonuclease system specificity protein McrC n=1 Tax=Marinimicrobium alkaliphilum TaxID=2202654 RepID=UPI000DB9150E|nr:5-methylcytosine-specific restriction endonuclease system specificity protein McrC [Marinimicrobium alkaliphilum]